jgi:hypothetical protein
MGKRCSQLPVGIVNLKLLYFLLVKFLLLYDMKIYVNNLLVQIDTSAASSYTHAYTNIEIYFTILDRLQQLCTHTQAS